MSPNNKKAGKICRLFLVSAVTKDYKLPQTEPEKGSRTPLLSTIPVTQKVRFLTLAD